MEQIDQEKRDFFSINDDKYIETLFLIGAIIAPTFVIIWDLFIPGKPFYLQLVSWVIALSLPFFSV